MRDNTEQGLFSGRTSSQSAVSSPEFVKGGVRQVISRQMRHREAKRHNGHLYSNIDPSAIHQLASVELYIHTYVHLPTFAYISIMTVKEVKSLSEFREIVSVFSLL
jgi:hypothetical protein